MSRTDDAVRVDRGELRAVANAVRGDDGARLWALTAVFAGDLVRTTGRKLLLLLPLLPAFGICAWIALRARVESLQVPLADQPAFALSQVRYALIACAVWGGMAAAMVAAGQVPRDLRAGALLLYFTRPIRRVDYVLGRWLATLGWLAVGTLVPVLLVVVVAASQLGWPPGGRVGLQGWLFWPGVAAAASVSALAIAAALASVALGAGSLLRNAASAGIGMVGLALASTVLANLFVLLWGRDSLVGALDLVQGITAVWTLLSRPLEAEPPPRVATLEAALACGVWLALAVGGWRATVRTVAAAPLGKGRA